MRIPYFLIALWVLTACAPRIAVRQPTQTDAGLRIVRAGHATIWLDIDGFRVATDPIFVGWLWMLPRADALGLDPENLPEIDTVLVSHTHMDHFDPWSIDKIPGRVPVLFPAASSDAPVRSEFYRRLVKAHPTYEFTWWKSVTVRNREGKTARITAVPALHWAGRHGIDGLWNDTYGGWVIESGGYTVYFAGDTGWDEAMFREIARRFPRIDLALLPIGPVMRKSTENRMSGRHINPPQALDAFELLGARYMVPIHYGAFFEGPFAGGTALGWLQELLQNHHAARRVAVLEPGTEWTYRPATEFAER